MQGQVGHGARAHPIQETGGRQKALHGFQPGLTTFVNEKKKNNEWMNPGRGAGSDDEHDRNRRYPPQLRHPFEP